MAAADQLSDAEYVAWRLACVGAVAAGEPLPAPPEPQREDGSPVGNAHWSRESVTAKRLSVRLQELIDAHPEEMGGDPAFDPAKRSLAEAVASALRLPHGAALMDGLSDADYENLRWDWRCFWARPNQLPPGVL